MVDIIAPVVDPGRDGFFPEQKIQVTGIFDGFILPGALPHTDNNFTATVPIQIPRIVQTGQIAHRRVEIDTGQFGCRQLKFGTIQYGRDRSERWCLQRHPDALRKSLPHDRPPCCSRWPSPALGVIGSGGE